jgi:hypothetical protein
LETILSVPKQNCHPDRSVAKWRDLRCAPRASQIPEFSRRLFSPGFSRPPVKPTLGLELFPRNAEALHSTNRQVPVSRGHFSP